MSDPRFDLWLEFEHWVPQEGDAGGEGVGPCRPK
jgi:hypothetical protein